MNNRYGPTRLLGEDAETVLLFAGGSGVSFTLSVMMELVRRARALALGRSKLAVCTQRILFVWSIKDASHIAWIDEKLKEAVSLAPPGLLKIKVYVTRMKEVPKARMSRQILPEEMYNTMENNRERNKTSSLPAAPASSYSPGRSPSSRSVAYQPSDYPPTSPPRSKSSRSRPNPSVRSLSLFITRLIEKAEIKH